MTCLFRFLFHLPCPTCGVTRALLSLLRLDIVSYCFYNAMAVPLCAAVILMYYGTVKKKKGPITISIIILIVNLLYFFYRLSSHLIP